MANVGKQFYNVGDAVHLLNDEQMLFIVTGVYNYHIGTGTNQRTEYEYEMLRVLPSTKGAHLLTRNQKDIELYARYEDKMWNLALDFIKRDRVKNGIADVGGIPPFVTMLKEYHEKNGNNQDINTFVKSKMGENENRGSLVRDDVHIDKDDDVYYNNLQTIDGCLDAMVLLDKLMALPSHPDEEHDKYLKESRERVVKKLKRLVKRG